MWSVAQLNGCKIIIMSRDILFNVTEKEKHDWRNDWNIFDQI